MSSNECRLQEQPARHDVYSRVTDAILAQLERGVRPWVQPWSATPLVRPLRANGVPYRGINVLVLWAAATEHGFTSPVWMTFRQAKEKKASVRQGEKGTQVVYAQRLSRADEEDEDAEDERGVYFLKSYTVFNAGQIDGLSADVAPSPTPATESPVESARRFLTGLGADIRHGGPRAFYRPGSDHVQMPPLATFRDCESYCSTLAHELTHWTKHPSRLDRDFGRKSLGDEGYAREELVAEIGSAFLCSDLGIDSETREDHAAYLSHWLTMLRDDKRAIFRAAGHAQKAADYLHALQLERGAGSAQDSIPASGASSA